VLTLTDNAAKAIRTVTEQPDLPSQWGLRIAPQEGDGGMLTLSMAHRPDPGDQIVESEGARIYLEPTAAAVLDEATLDAVVDPQGQVTFTVE
jgi:Fe-S cluster assembly iron-binding protein IscA